MAAPVGSEIRERYGAARGPTDAGSHWGKIVVVFVDVRPAQLYGEVQVENM